MSARTPKSWKTYQSVSSYLANLKDDTMIGIIEEEELEDDGGSEEDDEDDKWNWKLRKAITSRETVKRDTGGKSE